MVTADALLRCVRSRTLFTTGMIYASLRTIRQWHQPLTAPIYIALGLASGAVLLNLLLRIFEEYDPWPALLALACLLVAAAMKWAYWQRIDGEAREYKIGAATGLGHLGKVRQLEPPHTQPNFIMREMGYQIARKHAEKLRRLVLLLAFAVPIARHAADAGADGGGGDRRGAAGDRVDGCRPRRRALAVLRRGRARVDAVLRARDAA